MVGNLVGLFYSKIKGKILRHEYPSASCDVLALTA